MLGLCQGCVGAVSGLCWGCVGVLGCNGFMAKKACQMHVQKACQKCRAFQGLCQGCVGVLGCNVMGNVAKKACQKHVKNVGLFKGCARAVLVAGDRA